MASKPVQPVRPWRGVPLLRCTSGQSSALFFRGPYLLRVRFDGPVQVLLMGDKQREPILVCDGNSEQLVRLNDTVRIVVIGDASGAAEIVRWTGGPT